MKSLAFAVALLAAAQCNTPPSSPPAQAGGFGPIPWATGGGVSAGGSDSAGGAAVGDSCTRGYARAVEFGCPPVPPRTGAWVDACRNMRAHGLDAQEDCLLAAGDCAAVKRCMGESPR